MITCCTSYGRIPLNENKICCKFKQYSVSEKSIELYTRKELLMMETKTLNFHKKNYIPEIQKLAFCIPHVQILGTNRCGDSSPTVFKYSE